MNNWFVPMLNEVGVTFVYYECLSHRILSDGVWHMDIRLIVKFYEDTPYLVPSYLVCFSRRGGPRILLFNGYRIFFSGGKAVGTWSWPLASTWCRGEDWVGLYLCSLFMPSWCAYMDFCPRNRVGRSLGWINLAQDMVQWLSCEYVDEPSCSIKYRELLH